jgi:hypothetical protein
MHRHCAFPLEQQSSLHRAARLEEIIDSAVRAVSNATGN